MRMQPQSFVFSIRKKSCDLKGRSKIDQRQAKSHLPGKYLDIAMVQGQWFRYSRTKAIQDIALQKPLICPLKCYMNMARKCSSS